MKPVISCLKNSVFPQSICGFDRNVIKQMWSIFLYFLRKCTFLANFVTNIFCPYFPGWIYDITQKYDFSFYIAGLLYMVGIIFLLIQPCIQKKQSREKSTEEAQV